MRKYRNLRPILRHLRDGRPVKLRPLELHDLDQAEAFFAQLSSESRYLRFMTPMPRLTPEVVERLGQTLHAQRSLVIVASIDHDGSSRLIGGGRIVPTDRPTLCEFALTVLDAWHGHGLGTVLLRELERHARRLGYHEIEGAVLTVNVKMLAVALRRGFHLKCEAQDPSCMRVYKHLYAAPPSVDM